MSIVLLSYVSKNGVKILGYLALLPTYHLYNKQKKKTWKNYVFLSLVYLGEFFLLFHMKYQVYGTPKNESAVLKEL